MKKNGARDAASTLCSSCIPAEGLLKSGWLLIKLYIGEEEVVWEWSMEGFCKNICWILFILLLVTMIDGIEQVPFCHFLGTAGSGGGGNQ